jgi:hypothetical protein
MTEERARGTSLWLMPGGAVRERLAALLLRLAARLGTPPFAPHVTLLAGLGEPEDRVLATVRSLAPWTRPFEVRLVAVEGRDEPFRCLFARAEASAPLLAAHAAAARAFSREPDPRYLPHLSLVYGTLPAGAKSDLAAEVAVEAAESFEAARVHVWRTEGPVGDWREIGAYRLG